MKRMLHIVLALALVLTIFTANMIPVAYADETYNISFPLTVNVTGAEPIAGAYAEFTLTPLTEGAPMPENVDENGKIYLELTQKGENTITISMSYPLMGVYQYTIQMTDGTYYHESTQGTLYKLDVFNLSEHHDYENENYSGPNFFQIYTEIGGQKHESLEYNCPLTDIIVYKRWDDEYNDYYRPKEITAELFLNDKSVVVPALVDGKIQNYTYSDLVLSEKNDWKGIWNGLDALDETYWVNEKEVPPGYIVTYSRNGNVFKITNSKSLLQTGQLNWPIPVMYITGFLFLTAGILMLRRKEDENA